MSYSGNPSLSNEVKQRILSTFDQTVVLARDGNRQEALLGCDFVLRMDPQFQPAHVLQERLRASSGAVRVDDLLAAPSIADPFADLDNLNLDLPDMLPDPGLGGGSGGPGALRGELQGLLDQRRFPELMAAAQRQQAAVMADSELQRIVGAAQELMEAEPYVLKFLAGARQALQSGDATEVSRLLDKARALDPDHPGLAEVDRLRLAMPVKPAAPAFELPSPLQSTAVPASLAMGGGDSESDRRIRELLDEGQRAFDGGDPQGAIDAWSRIFLIDIDHQEASRRIEGARRLKAEAERQVEEIFHEGVAFAEAGDVPLARRAFQRVLEIQPGYYAAREYLQQIEAGTLPPPRSAAGREAPAAAPVLSPIAGLDDAGSLKEEILVPPEPGGAAAPVDRRPLKKTAAAAKARDGGRARRLFLLIGGAVLLLALVGAWFYWNNKNQMFPNASDGAAVPAPPLSADPIARAERLHKAGKTSIALNQLRRIPPSDPNYARAQKLMGEWGGAVVPATAPDPNAAGPGPDGAPAAEGVVNASLTPEVSDRRAALIVAARQASAEQRYLRALSRLQLADSLGRLDGDDARLMADIQRKLEPISVQVDLFRQHEWEAILPELWRLHEAAPADRDVTQLIVDSYYNLAVRDLQRADAMKGAEKLKEALNLQEDEVLRRHYQFAQTYQERPKDLLYRIYVKYLPFR
ncbi:MAG: hypothetical protein ACJ75H_00575 [Thermoanaerobaculia bacterium]